MNYIPDEKEIEQIHAVSLHIGFTMKTLKREKSYKLQ